VAKMSTPSGRRDWPRFLFVAAVASCILATGRT
jgi:hypothetical protein